MDNRKRYQIFVSSTFADLKEERKMVMQAILERKGFPAGMELFPAKDKKQFDYIRQVINDSDYYLLIIGARYGSLDDDGVSYTEKEYDYAVSQKIPVIAFLHSDIKTIPLGKADVDKELQQKLEAFRAKVQTGRLVNYWENPHDLKAKVISSLVDAFEDQDRPRIGWVRADSVANGDSQMEIERLTIEIIKHQNEVKRLKGVLNLKEEDRLELEYLYKDALKEINNLKDQVKTLETELEKLKEIMLQPQKIIIPGTDVSFNMIFVEGGTFMMGANNFDKEANKNERPAHKVTLSDYWIGETLVTQELWKAVMGRNPSHFKGEYDLPVESVSWLDCKKFINRLNEKTNYQFALPTEEEWEYAASGGKRSQGFKYAGSNIIDEVAWYRGNANGIVHPVSEKKPNELGLYDMSGNVWEWTKTPAYSYTTNTETGGNVFIRRGGSWWHEAKNCRVIHRYASDVTKKTSGLGLRLVFRENIINR